MLSVKQITSMGRFVKKKITGLSIVPPNAFWFFTFLYVFPRLINKDMRNKIKPRGVHNKIVLSITIGNKHY